MYAARMRRLFLLASSLVLLTACTANGEASLTRRQERLQEAAELAKNPPIATETAAPGVPLETYRIPILVYHHVRPQEGWAKTTWSWKMTVTRETFERHMQWLADHGYATITLDTMMEILQGVRAGPEKPVVITFDDNNLNQYDAALPILEKHGQVAVFYLITKYLDSSNAINRDRVKDLVARGQDIQSHTMTHRVLTGLNDEELDWELQESKRILEEVTGRSVYHVAYPGTGQNERVRDHARAAGYVTGTIMDPRTATENDDLLKLPRIMMTDDTDLAKILP